MDYRSYADIMETDTSAAAELTQLPETESIASGGGRRNAVVWELLTLARQLINQGKPTQALQAAVMAMRTDGGDEAVFRSLHRARELYKSRMQENVAVDQLASLFAECAIAEAQPLRAEVPPDTGVSQWVVPDADRSSILAETGRMQIVMDAFSDGSSFICLQCGGLVSNQRKDEHYAYWCCRI